MKALVLSSGGLDSTVCLAQAVKDYGKDNVISMSIYYGQNHTKELESARKVADYYEVKHYEMDLTDIFKQADCALLKGSSKEIRENMSYEDQIKQDGVVNTYVPFRNGTILSIAATQAYSLFKGELCDIIIGVHADDAAGNAYADCSLPFIEYMIGAIKIGTYEKVLVKAPLVTKTKAEVVKQGLELKVPFNLTWSCYKGGEKACGICATCIDRLKAFAFNNEKDPIEYEVGLKTSK